MKRKYLLFLSVAILILGWQNPVKAQDIPVNYTQNPNMEHILNPIFWYGGWDAVYGSNGIARYPSLYVTDKESHSGNQSLYFFSQWHYVWVSYPCRGQEEKKMKASFWYKGKLQSYWNFVYRDLGMTEEDLPPSLAEYVGADTCWHHYGGQDALRFDFGGPNDETPDWTYFEFVWDMPGTIKGWGNTAMWYSDVPEAFVDDLYYGEYYDGEYSGEEPFGFVNGDFEKTELNTEWLVNVAAFDNFFLLSDFLSWTENKTDAGLQSLRLMDYWEVFPDTMDVVAPYDSVAQDTSFMDKNVTYYLPALGADGKDMEMSFWYKGNAASIDLEFYSNYGITPAEFALPAGAALYSDTANPVYDIDTTDIIEHIAADTFAVADKGDYMVYMLQIDTMMLASEEILGEQNFDDEADRALPGDGAWVWSGSSNYGYNDWDGATTEDEAWSSPRSLWLPGDPSWGGGEGYIQVVDDTNYIWEFMYKGKLQFILNLGDAKYDLAVDPDGIVPPDATVDGGSLTWQLDSKYWKRFRFEYSQGSWLADSSAASPATVSFDIIGTYDGADVGWVDDLMVAMGSKSMMIDTNYVVIESDTSYEYVTDTVGMSYPPMGARWNLAAAADWTQWTLQWTNPSSDIGGTLTMHLDNTLTAAPDWITLANSSFDDDNANWTYFDDFVYQEQPSSVRPVIASDLHVYPNPAVDVLYLSLQVPLRKVEIYNVMGQRVRILLNPDRKFSVSDLASGMYLLHATDADGMVHEVKFIKK